MGDSVPPTTTTRRTQIQGTEDITAVDGRAIKGELFGAGRLAAHARDIARAHRIAPIQSRKWLERQRRGPLLARLDDSERLLAEARDILSNPAGSRLEVSPAGAWFLDNFFVVLEQIREIRATLPSGYYHELPKLAEGAYAGYPRVYNIVLEFIAHTDGRLSLPGIERMVREYQTIAPLTMGELWAIPAMLRMGFLENIRRMALVAVRDLRDRELADEWVANVLGAPADDALTATLMRFVHQSPHLSPTFVTRFLQQIRSRRSDFTPLLWLEQWVADEYMPIEEAAQQSMQEQALTQLVMANSIVSLRAVGSIDWNAFVESSNTTEAVLRCDPAGVYPTMTTATRDRYRHVVERIAKETNASEPDVAAASVELAEAGALANGRESRFAHVGHYLVGEGRKEFERTLGYRAPGWSRLTELVLAYPGRAYFGGLVTAVALLFTLLAQPLEHASPAWVAILVILALLPASDAAIAIVNQLAMLIVPPARLARLDYQLGVPEQDRTVVVVPLLLGSVDAVDDALKHLEAQHLANRDPEIRFAILSDFTDAPTETAETDDAIIEAALSGIRALNDAHGVPAKEGATPTAPFYLFHRRRLWNAVDGIWMGWERKRGKLVEFNAFASGINDHSFATAEGDMGWLLGARYVITLDADTNLPRGAAAALIGTMAHPLNRAEFDAERGRVVRGYGILQPRVSVSLASANESRFAAIYAGHPGVDPYTTAVSDVYQDLFGEGTFTGKGIYDLEVFRQSTAGRFPDNTLLSHDLIEGTFARAGLVTDVEVFDDYPARYLTSTRRLHRWIRGDWQLLPWLSRRVPGPNGRSNNPLSALSRWKIVDNMRRSATPVSLLAWLVAGWTFLPGSGITWTVLALATYSVQWAAALVVAACLPPPRQSWRPYYASLGHDASNAAMQFVLAVVLLPDQAFLAADAIARSLVRIFVTKRRMLEWQTASQVERATALGRGSVWRRMWPSVALAALLMLMVVWEVRKNTPGYATQWLLPVAAMLLTLCWLASPEVAIALSAPRQRTDLFLSNAERATAIRYALQHWRYFERFVTAETHWLVPDNFQETPEPVIASRTSPTNMGLQLLATMSAFDLGFLTRHEMLDRLERAFDTMGRLTRVHGHFLNWYDLGDLRVLDPPYVSTVDSGNLAGHLVALCEGCLAVIDAPVDDGRLWVSLEAEGSAKPGDRRSESSGATATGWIGERLVAYQKAELALRRHSSTISSEKDEEASDDLWARQRLEATIHELTEMGLETDVEATLTLRAAAETSPAAAALVARLESIAARAGLMAMEMDFRVLFEPQRKLLAIGYDVRSGTLDDAAYDLLASESRLASFIAVAKGDIAAEHWFRLGRSLTTNDGATALVSWSGSMFEYLMPLLVMPLRPFSLLDQTCRAAVRRQIAYGHMRKVPWGISESAYNVRDRHDTYQYRAFGVPDLALKRGLAGDLVVAPYATVLAAVIDPHKALNNLAELEREHSLGAYGFYDALDYTHLAAGEAVAVVRTYMAHHIGMSLVALDNALSVAGGNGEGIWSRRFMSAGVVRGAALLLDERVPRRYLAQPPQSDAPGEPTVQSQRAQTLVHEIDTADTPEPHVALLGGIPYSVLITNAGSGYSRANGMDVLRWRADATQDDTGQWIYIRDTSNDAIWSVTHQPTHVRADHYRVAFSTDRVVFDRRDGGIDTRMEVVVMPSDQAEIRRVTLVNRSRTTRELELTSYGEVVLSDPAADRAHPAFQKLFVQTEWLPESGALLATRRPRSADEPRPWCAHVVASGLQRVGRVTCETDRARFLGRGRTARAPRALDPGVKLSGTVGAVLDPIVALRIRVRLEPGRSATVAFTTAVAGTREAAAQLADRYRDLGAAERALSLSATEARVELNDLDIESADAGLYQQLAGALIYPHEALRAPEPERAANRRGQSALWAQGISGDWPIVLATIRVEAGLASVRQLLAAHKYWRMKGLRSDLVILNAKTHSYARELHDQLVAMAMASSEGGVIERPGGVFIRRADMLSKEDESLLRATASIHVICDGVGLGEIVAANITRHAAEPSVGTAAAHVVRASAIQPIKNLIESTVPALANGYGALTDRGDYAISVAGDSVPPAPWANVIANPNAGFCVTERGGGFVWVENSHFFRLTPWFNDPVSDPCGEVLYLQEATGGPHWTPTPGPSLAREAPGGAAAAAYGVRHAPGMTTFVHEHIGIGTELSLGVPNTDPVKISRLRITNRGREQRQLTLTNYVEWALGADRETTSQQVHTRRDDQSGALFAQNFFAPDFASRVAFSWISEPVASHTSRRDEFVGRNGDLTGPAALTRQKLSGASGAGYDPCAALRCTITLAPGETREVITLLGAAASDDEARALIARYAEPGAASTAIDDAARAWDERLSVITVRTPDADFDAMLNRWSLYQALACRMWARSALYQSSGAYGFRDQLQDSMAFVYAAPDVAREHLLRAAARQFIEGDVQHWWHEPSGRGVRTRFSDDLAWLAYVTDHYVNVTGDTGVLDACAAYVKMRPLAANEHEVYDLPETSEVKESLYTHCVRALDHACTSGPHGLPLMGSGDWNDGMNRVGVKGIGESVWLAWFLIATLRRFAAHATARGDAEVAARFLARADGYVTAVERDGWDGAWYARAYYDDGTILGSSKNDECQIDSIAQSWAVLSAAGDPARAHTAMQSVFDRLVREDARIVLLLAPPFDHTDHDPGYIKGYVPGVRENGAQYTHAAFWTALAAAKLGDGNRAGALLSMLNPLTRTRTRADADVYKVEPYVVAADVYAAPGHIGRGGWTWYTGSASWSYRASLEGLLGFEKRGDTLSLNPCIPTSWPEFTIEYRFRTSRYEIVVHNPRGVSRGVTALTVDGTAVQGNAIALVDDGAHHAAVVTLG
ncbi:MAG: glucoamylase family protein [bacterium]